MATSKGANTYNRQKWEDSVSINQCFEYYHYSSLYVIL